MGKKCDIILNVVIKEVRGYEKPGTTGIISEGRPRKHSRCSISSETLAVSLREKVIQV